MVAPTSPQSDARGTGVPHPAGPVRAAWLVLAADGPAASLPALAAGTTVRVVSDPARFRAMLLAERPLIVVCAEPPADRAVLDLVVSERRRRARMRAVHLSAPEAVEPRLAALAAGFDDAVTTTMAATELVARVAWLAARARPQREDDGVLEISDRLELDLPAHELRRDGRVVHLRPKEFGLLALLAAHPGRAFSRQELLDRVWGPDHGGGARTVDVHVRWLRSKIEPEPVRPVHLVTVRGLGYRLDGPRR
ncbi:MAG TPA: response regulator transcription factor [Candidatus Limnocylindrales bacterium]|nr:response regulator transcription factor [Candidatus Limnocylindrales bacterium]